MKNIEVTHRVYNEVLYTIMNEEDSLSYIKTVTEDDISKAIWKEHGKTTQNWAKYAHAHHLWYPVTIYDNNNPYAYISYGSEFIEVYFLDERLFEYIYMAYRIVDEEKMFLSKIYIREYMYEEKEDLQDLKKDMTLIFSQNGNLTLTTETIIREPSVKIEREEKEAAHPVNVSQNWKKIPNYGEYDELLDYESIIKPGDLLKGIDTSAGPPTSDNEADQSDGKSNHPWLPKDWSKN